MNRFRSLLGGVVLTTLCFGIACSDDDSVEPTFDIKDQSDASVDAGNSGKGASTSEDGSPEAATVNAPAASSTTADASASAASTDSADTNVAEADAGTTADGANTTDDVMTSSGPDEISDTSGDTGEPEDCFRNPTTHLEIINACTTAVVIKKTPNLTGLNNDGSLPPLP
jgi:hypothetical protein